MMRIRPGVALLLLILLLLTGLPGLAAGASEPTKHVVLIDGSGSMEDDQDKIYLYSTEKVKALVTQLLAVEGAFAAQDQLALGIFSKADQGRGLQSPIWVYEGTVAGFRANQPDLKPIRGWTDLVGSLDAGVAKMKGHTGPQLLWLLTDNIDQESDETDSTERFYESLAQRSDLNRIYVFPVDVGEPRRGLVLYSMVRLRSEKARPQDDARLDQAVAAINGSPLKPQLGDGGFLVRPLSDQGLKVEVVDFVPERRPGTEIQWKLNAETGQLIVAGYDEGTPVRGQLTIRLTSLLPALKIADAKITATIANLASPDFSLPEVVTQKITPTKVSLEPGQVAEYVVDLAIEPPSLIFSALKNPMAALQDFGEIRADLQLVVSDVTYVAIQPDRFFKVQRIPEILGNQSKVVLPVAVPMQVLVRPDPIRPLVALVVLLLVVGLLFLLYKLTLGRRYTVRITMLDLDRTEPVTLRRRLQIPNVGSIRMTALGALIFVPDPRLVAEGEKRRNLHGGTGQVLLKGGLSFRYEVGARKKRVERGGYRYAR